jgi:nicotinate phosphoribosyltransferase
MESLLVTVLDDGRRLLEAGGVEQARKRRTADLERLDPGVRRLVNPHRYHVSLTTALSDLKRSLVAGYLD